jgi:putative Mn2+ efflux pump MntP
MDLLTLFGLAIALALDAFSVAVATGVCLPTMTGRHLFRLGFHFGLFQALMPIAGWYAGLSVQRWISAYGHWIAFLLLSAIAAKMIHEALASAEAKECPRDPTRGWSLVGLSVATSIDALAVGFSMSALGVDIWRPALIIGLVAGLFTLAGMLLGRRVGRRWQRVELLGGVVLLGIGLKILLEH